MTPTTRRIVQVVLVGVALLVAVGSEFYQISSAWNYVPVDDLRMFNQAVIGSILVSAGLFVLTIGVAFWLESLTPSPVPSTIPAMRRRGGSTTPTESTQSVEFDRIRRRAEHLAALSLPTKAQGLFIAGQLLLVAGFIVKVPTYLDVSVLLGVSIGAAICVNMPLLVALNVFVYRLTRKRVRKAKALLQRTAQPNPAP